MSEAMTISSDWRPIPGFRGFFASRYGKIGRIIRTEDGSEIVMSGLVTQRDDGRGYMIVDLTVDGKRSTCKVHRLVYMAFHGLPPSGFHIDHIDHDKSNNSINNLRLRDPIENSADCAKTSRRGMRVLTDKQRRMVAMLCLSNHGTKSIADLCGIGETTVRRIRRQARDLVKESRS